MHHNARQRLRRFNYLCVGLGLCGCVEGHPTQYDASAAVDDKPLKAPMLTVAANHPETYSPLDATPSPDGSRIYYLAIARDASDQPSAGVFGVDAAAGGSGEVDELSLGAPLLSPVAIASSLDGASLFVADTAAGMDAAGAVYRVSTSGGTPQLVPGTEGYRPAGLVVGEMGRQETLFFTGRDPDDGAAGVFQVASAGGAPDTVARFDADSEPGGVALAHDGVLYVAENTGSAARVLRVRDGSVSSFVDGIALGFPAGIALTHDDQTLLISGLDPATRHDAVYRVAVASGELSQLTDAVAGFRESAGLHRAHDVDVFAWADSQANDFGTVYAVKF